MAYQTVFETGIGRCPLWFPAFGLIFVAIGVALLKWYRSLQATSPLWPNRRWPIRAPNRRGLKYFAWAFFGGSVLWTVTAFAAVTAECYQRVQTLNQSTARVVEGRVTDFLPMPYAGHQDEAFTVNGVRFSYSDFGPTCGFNHSASHGGPIREGLQVRIPYVGNAILKLEVAR